jgi:hypothetical protein
VAASELASAAASATILLACLVEWKSVKGKEPKSETQDEESEKDETIA